MSLSLTESGREEEETWGRITLGIRLQPKTLEEKEGVSSSLESTCSTSRHLEDFLLTYSCITVTQMLLSHYTFCSLFCSLCFHVHLPLDRQHRLSLGFNLTCIIILDFFVLFAGFDVCSRFLVDA